MKIAIIYKLSLWMAVSMIISSCSKQEDIIIANEKEILVGLQITPSLEQDSYPLSRTSMLEEGIYAINVFWEKNNSYRPYATGLFDRTNDISIGLIEGYKYRFDCTFISKKELYCGEGETYGLPFSVTPEKVINATVTNKLVISINPFTENTMFHQHIYKGAMHLKADSTSTRPADVHRFYGSSTIDLKNISAGGSSPQTTSLTLKRAYYTLQFAAEYLAAGDSIKAKITTAKPFVIKGDDASLECTYSEERLLSLENIVSNPSWDGNILESESIPVTVYYRPKEALEWTQIINSQIITVKRNNRNLIIIKNIENHYKEQTEISFEGDNNNLAPTTKEEQTIG